MTDLTGKLIANTYKDILTINSSATNEGLDNTLRRVQDGEGTNSSLKLSETSAAFTGNVSVNGNLTINGAFQPQNIQTSAVRATTVSATNITTNTLNADTLTFQDVSVSTLRAGTVSATTINTTNITVDGDGVATSSALASVEAVISSNIVFVLNAQASVLTVLAGLAATDLSLQNNINSVSATTSANGVLIASNSTQINVLSSSITANASAITVNASAITVNSDAITSINSVIGGGAFASVGTSATLETRIAGVSTALVSTSAALTSHINTVSATLSIANVSIAANSSQISAVSVLTQTNKDAITSINGVLGTGAFASAGTSATLQTKINAVSALTSVNAAAITSVNTRITANASVIAVVSALTSVNAAAITSVNTIATNAMPKSGGAFTGEVITNGGVSAKFYGPVDFNNYGILVSSNASAVFKGRASFQGYGPQSAIQLGNSSTQHIDGVARWGTGLIPTSTATYDFGNDSLRWNRAYITEFIGGINSGLTSVSDILAGDSSSKPVNSSWVQDRVATKASVGTSATLETRIAAVSALTSVNAVNIAAVSALTSVNVAAITSVNTRINAVSVLAASVSSTMAASIDNQMPKSGGTFTGDVLFADGQSAKFVNSIGGDNLIITGITSTLGATGTLIQGKAGVLNIKNDGNIKLAPKADELGIVIATNSAVDLYYNNSKKLATTSIGIYVSGAVSATSFYGDGSNLTGIPATGASVGTSATLETRIAAVSALTSVNVAAIASVNTIAVAALPKTGGTVTGNVSFQGSSITLGNSMNDIIYGSGLFGRDIIPSSATDRYLGDTSRPWNFAYLGAVVADNITVSGTVSATSFYGDGSNLTNIPATGASVGTSATLETRIAAVSSTMATSIGNSNSAITALSATMATSVATRLALAGGTMTGNLILNADPSASLQAASKQYVDNLTASSIHIHEAVRVETNGTNLNATYNNGSSGVGATLTNAGTQAALAIDGVTLNTSDRVLVMGQTNQTQNGVYVVTNTGSGSTNWILTRSDDADTSGDGDANSLDEGSYFFVQEGTVGAAHAFVCNTQGTIVFGTTNITFAQFSDSVEYTAGTGININASRVISTSGVATTGQLTALSATMATSIGNQMPLAGGTFTGQVIFNNNGFTVNSNASAVFNGPINMNSSIRLGNSTGDTITGSARWGSDIIPTSTAGRVLGTDSLRWDEAYINRFVGSIDGIETSVTGLIYPSPYGKAPATVDYVTSAVAAKASVGTSATLETRIAAVSATMATSINNIGTSFASAGTSATLETRIAAVSATMATSISNSNTAIATLSATLATSISNYLPLAGGTVTGDVSFGDSDKAIFGTGSDLEIYHDGFRSVIKDAGEFRFMSNTLRLTNTGNNAYFTAFNGGAATLFHSGSAKLGTTTTGINVTGNVTATAFYGDGSNLTGITITAASVGTSATLQTKINTLSATMATSIGNSNSAITALSATMAASIGNSNTNITTNANAITSINSVLGTSFASAGTSATLETRINAVSVLAETKASATTSATLETRIAGVSSTFATTSATLATSIATAAAAAVAFAIALG